jgi:hypothetical protein
MYSSIAPGMGQLTLWITQLVDTRIAECFGRLWRHGSYPRLLTKVHHSRMRARSHQSNSPLTAGAGGHGCLPGDYASEKRTSDLPGAIGGHSSASLGGVVLSDTKRLPATDDGEYQYEIKVRSRRPYRVVIESELMRFG